LADVELSEADAAKLTEVERELARVELILERESQKKFLPVYQKRREILKGIPKFWAVALLGKPEIMFQCQHIQDQIALSYLEDVWIERDPAESRCFTIEFHFKENPFFSDSVLKKEYKYIPSPGAANEKPDADGLTPSAVEFSWERDVEPQSYTIHWKSDDKNLTKLYAQGKDDEDEIVEPGSFFHFFEEAADPFELGIMIANDIFAEAAEYFQGRHADDSEDEEDDDDDDSDAEEIDLEKPKAKKPKKA